MLDQLMAAHHARNGLADLLESDPPVAEGLHGHFVGGVEHRRHRSAGFSRPARQAERRKTVEVRLFKGKTSESGEIGLHAIVAGAFGISERVLNGQAHVRSGELREDRAVHELDH